MTAQRIAPRQASAKATISALKAPPAPLQGTHARIAVVVQGHIWSGLANTVTIVDRAETAERIDERGDAEMRKHRSQLVAAARMALQERAYQTHRMLMDEIARTDLLIELDDHEDGHRRAMADEAIEANGSLHRANGGVGRLLGQAEATACDLLLPHRLDGALVPGVCGKVRRADAPRVGTGLTTAACRQVAGHETPCVFAVVPERSAL